MSQYEPAYLPIRTAPPSDTDRLLDRTLLAYTDKEITLEPDEGMQKRDRLLLELERIFKEWVRYVAEHVLKLPEEVVQECGGQLFVSGSHRLGIKEPGADIDTVCVAPNFCTRHHFFSSLKQRLLDHPAVTELSAIEGIRVPIMAFDFYGISIDLLFAKLAENSVPRNVDIFNDEILRNLDKESEISLNGPRVTDMIRKLVPKYDTFVYVLRCVRKWAKVKGLYGNKFGYLGGVNFNLLLAFVSQLYPNASTSFLLIRFFRLYSGWKWPTPIKLNKLQPNPPGENREIWSEEKAEESRYNNLMPIITPAYPAANSSYNVSEHTLKVMTNEFIAANNVVSSITSKLEKADWERLFTPSDFFISYNHYLLCHIIGSTGDEDAEEAARGWVGFVESRMRWVPSYLAQRLQLSAVHLFPKEQKSDKGTVAVAYYVGFNVEAKAKTGDTKVLRVDQCISDFRDHQLSVFTKTEGHVTNNFMVEHLTWKNLPEQVFEPLGGKAKAKRMRKEKLAGLAPRAKVAAENEENDKKTELGVGAGAGVADAEAAVSKKRKLSETEDVDGSDSKHTSKDGILSRLNDQGDGPMGAEENDGENSESQKSLVDQSKNRLLAAQIPDVSGRDFIPMWRRGSTSGAHSGEHHNHEARPIQVTWSLLDHGKA